jgi:hypothetical protein
MLTLAATLGNWYPLPFPSPPLPPQQTRRQCVMFGTNCRVPSKAPARTDGWPDS